MKAKFNGKYVECGETIKVGKEIMKNSREIGSQSMLRHRRITISQYFK